MPSSNLKQSENSEKMEDESEEGSKGGLLGLPESDTELDVSFISFCKIGGIKTEECNKQKNNCIICQTLLCFRSLLKNLLVPEFIYFISS